MARHWLRILSEHIQRMRSRYPDDRLLVVFDLEGIAGPASGDAASGGTAVGEVSAELEVPGENRWVEWHGSGTGGTQGGNDLEVAGENFRTPLNLLPAPFAVEFMRWLQLEEKVHIGIHATRPSFLRKEISQWFRMFGRPFSLELPEDMIYMRKDEKDAIRHKLAGLRYFQERNFRIVAVVDDNLLVLRELRKLLPGGDVLLIHRPSPFAEGMLPAGIVPGDGYDLGQFVQPGNLPRSVQYVWHGVNDARNLSHFLESGIEWMECDIRFDPEGKDLILRHDAFHETPVQPGERWLTLEDVLDSVREAGKKLKLDFKEGGRLILQALEQVKRFAIEPEQLWMNGYLEHLGRRGLLEIRKIFPETILQVPVDILKGTFRVSPETARRILDTYASWGINRFSLSWRTADRSRIFRCLKSWGYEINFYNIPDLRAFLVAVLLEPRSITADFNFPEWGLYGRGSGERMQFHRFPDAPFSSSVPPSS